MQRILTVSTNHSTASAIELQKKINKILSINHNIKISNITSLEYGISDRYNNNTVMVTFDLEITLNNCVSNEIVKQFENSFI